jgi:hypothetical protein
MMMGFAEFTTEPPKAGPGGSTHPAENYGKTFRVIFTLLKNQDCGWVVIPARMARRRTLSFPRTSINHPEEHSK